MATFEFEFEPELERRREEQSRQAALLQESLDRVGEWRRRLEDAENKHDELVQRREASIDHLGGGRLRPTDLLRETERLAALDRMIADLDRRVAEIHRDLAWAEERAALRRHELEAALEAVTMLEKLRSQRLLEWNRAARKRQEKAAEEARMQSWQRGKDQS